MPKLISNPTIIESAGNKPKIIKEFIGGVNTKSSNISIAKMTSPGGWEEPGQTPEFDEYTLVLKGMLRVETKGTTFDVNEGQAIITYAGEWIRYSTPNPEGAEYVAICLKRKLYIHLTALLLKAF
jgi:mannose-6-phosphate isomerase-like protein (cupin superfamily)